MDSENFTSSYKTIWALLCLIALITIYPFFEIGITNGDDLMYYHLSFHKNLWPLALDFAKDNGRFYFAIVNPLYTFPYTFDNFAFTKVLQYSSLLSTFLIFTLVIRKIFSSTEMGIFMLIFLLTTLSLSKWTSLIVCYPFCFCFSFTLILTSILLLLYYLEKGGKKLLLFSSILYFIGLLFYEVYLIYLIIVAIIVIAHYNQNTQQQPSFPFKKVLYTLLPYIVVGAVYLTLYFSFYILYPTNYAGNAIASEVSLKSVFSILKNYPESAFPLSVFYQNKPIFQYQSDLFTGHRYDLWYILTNAKVEWLVKAALICLTVLLIHRRLPKISIKATLVGIIISLILIYLSHIFLTVTKKYNVDYPELKGYISTFYSFFGVVLLFSLICNLVYTYASRFAITRVIFICMLLPYLFICSVQTSYSNYYTAKDMAQARLSFDVLDDFMKSKEFNSLPDSSIVYAEDLWQNSSAQINLFHQGFNWEGHIYNKTKKLVRTARNKEIFNTLRKTYTHASTYTIKKQEAHKTMEAVLLFSPIKHSPSDSSYTTSNSVTIFYHSTYKEFCISFKMKGAPATEKKIAIGSYHDSVRDNYYSVNISGNNKNIASTIVKIIAPDIDLNSIIVSNIRQTGRPTIEVFE